MELKGIKINFLGDSITEGHGTSAPENTFCMLIEREYEAICQNYGIGGTRRPVGVERMVLRSGNHGGAVDARAAVFAVIPACKGKTVAFRDRQISIGASHLHDSARYGAASFVGLKGHRDLKGGFSGPSLHRHRVA